jgi:hypothetical protein
VIDWYQDGYDDGYNGEPYAPPMDLDARRKYDEGYDDGDEALVTDEW